MLANVMKYNFLEMYDKITNLAAPGYDDREISYLLSKAQNRVFFHLYNPMGNKYQKGFEMGEKRKRDLAELTKYVTILPGNESLSISYVFTQNANPRILDLVGGTDVRGLADQLTIYGGFVAGGSAKILKILTGNRIYLDKNSALPVGSVGVFTSGLGLSQNQAAIHTLTTSEIKGYLVDLPSLFLYFIEEAVKTSEAPNIFVPVKPITHDFVRANMRNPYTKPWKNLIWRLDFSKNISGLGNEDDTTLNDVYQFGSSFKRTELITNGSTITEYYVRYLSLPRPIVVDETSPENQVSCELDESVHDMIIDEAVKIATSVTEHESYEVKTVENTQSE